jgi:hypothetical protein
MQKYAFMPNHRRAMFCATTFMQKQTFMAMSFYAIMASSCRAMFCATTCRNMMLCKNPNKNNISTRAKPCAVDALKYAMKANP